jgi:hypothetical protein
MAGETGYNTPTGKIVVRGEPNIVLEKEVETTTNVKPGRLLKMGTTEAEVKVFDGVSAPAGWCGWEQASPEFKKEAISTAFDAADSAPLIRGGPFVILAKQAPGFVSVTGDIMFSWGASGQVAPGGYINGQPAVRINVINTATVETDTKVDMAAGMWVKDCIVEATAGGAGGVTISVGTNETVGGGEVGGDANGFLAAEVLASNTRISHNIGPTGIGVQTLGALLKTTEIKDANGTFTVQLKGAGYVCDGTAISITYTTTNTVGLTGYIWLIMGGPGVTEVGKCAAGVSSASAEADVLVENAL